MSIVTLQLPKVKCLQQERPKECPNCSGGTFQRWGGTTKVVRDPQLKEVIVYRYRCCNCHKTFRHYPQGIGRASQTERMQMLAAICWLLGLSYRGIGLGVVHLG